MIQEEMHSVEHEQGFIVFDRINSAELIVDWTICC